MFFKNSLNSFASFKLWSVFILSKRGLVCIYIYCNILSPWKEREGGNKGRCRGYWGREWRKEERKRKSSGPNNWSSNLRSFLLVLAYVQLFIFFLLNTNFSESPLCKNPFNRCLSLSFLSDGSKVGPEHPY